MLEIIAEMARDHGLTAFIDATDACVYVFVPHNEARDLFDDSDALDDAIPCRTLADVQAALWN